MDAFVDVFAQLGYLRLADAGQPHRLHQIVDPAGRHAADPGLLDHRDQRLLGALAGFQKWREIAALAQLWDAQLQGAEPGVEAAVAVAIAPPPPPRLAENLRHQPSPVARPALISLRSSRPLACFRSKSCNSTLADWTDDHLNHTAARHCRSTRKFHHQRGR